MLDESGHTDSKLEEAADKNASEMSGLIEGIGTLSVIDVEMSTREGAVTKRTGPRRAANLFDETAIAPYSDIIVDISALPRALYTALLGKLVHLLESEDRGTLGCRGLFVFVGENLALDSTFTGHLVEHADYVTFFQRSPLTESEPNVPKIWFPTFGENQLRQLQCLYEFIAPHEICPVLPMPSIRPRRADDLVRDYSTLLFDTWQVSPADFVYVAEQNPFEAYRQIVMAIRRYRRALAPMGGNCRIILSSLSSKLLSVASFMAAFEFKSTADPVAIAHVEAASYSSRHSSEPNSEAKPFLMMLCGAAYEI